VGFVLWCERSEHYKTNLANCLIFSGFQIFQVFCDLVKNYRKSLLPNALSQNGIQRGGGFARAGVSQRFGRATHLKISTKVRAGIHPRSCKTARCTQAFDADLS